MQGLLIGSLYGLAGAGSIHVRLPGAGANANPVPRLRKGRGLVRDSQAMAFQAHEPARAQVRRMRKITRGAWKHLPLPGAG